MKKKYIRIAYLSLIILLSTHSLSQEINPSIVKNLSPAQIKAVRNELQKNTPTSESKEISESTKKIQINEDINQMPGKKYGYAYFSTVPTTISAVGDLPLPNDYRISLNDQFTVIMSGSVDNIFDVSVNLDGTISLPEIGAVSVAGETFNEVKTKLRNLIKQSYIGVNLDLSLKNLSAKKITIVGAVKNPGTYLVNPFSTISSALAYSGGISEIGTLRNIKLKRIDGRTYNFDLYELLMDGDRSHDITIESGDVIVIDPAEHFINLAGQVRRPAIYEVKEDETLADLILFGLGFTETANKSNINLQVLDIDTASIKNINSKNLISDLKNVYRAEVNSYVNKNITSINVDGAIKEPGFYSLKENKDLETLINNLEFIDVYPWLGVLEQFDENNLIKSSILFSLNDPNTYRSIKLLPNSKLYFANINSIEYKVNGMTLNLINDYRLNINHKQGSYSMPVYGNYSVNSFINFLGLDMSDVDEVATYISPLESIVVKDNYKNMQFSAKKYNTVSFRSKINDLIKVNISGAVDYPGVYTLESNSTLQDLYSMIGNFKDEAFFDGIIFSRASIRERQIVSIQKSKQDLDRALLTSMQKGDRIGDINIIKALSESIEPEYLGRIAGNFQPNTNAAVKTILADGDTIFVPKNPNVINVLGEVLNPIAFEYNKKINVNEAIKNAGGYQDYANKRKVYVIRANGLIEKAPKNIFLGSVTLQPGDTIVVPRKIITNNPGIDALLPITQILSDFAFSAAAIESLSNNK